VLVYAVAASGRFTVLPEKQWPKLEALASDAAKMRV
jgi:hypothetical protein